MATNRREFLKVTGSGIAAAAASGLASAAPPDSIPVMKVGMFGLDYSFSTIYADCMSPKSRRLGTSLLRMRPAYIWDKDTKKAQQFAQQYECDVVDKFDAMLGKVDVIINGELNVAPWEHLLLRPYIEAGVPCFLQRHWSDSLVHMDEMLELAAKHNTPIMATVPFEHFNHADVAIAELKDIGEIQGVFAAARVSDEPHFHLPYMMMKILGYDVESIAMNTDDYRKTGFLNMDYVFPKSDKRNRPFALSMQGSGPDLFSFDIVGQHGNVTSKMSESADFMSKYFGQMLDAQKSFEKRALYQPLDVIRKKFQCLQTAYYSKLERNGAPVKVGTVPADYKIPAWKPDAFTAADFKA
jgi:hypothetical protein